VRQEVAAKLKAFGLRHIAGALMWVLAEVLHLEEEKMYCRPDSYRGAWLLDEISSSLDETTERELFTRLFAAYPPKTILFITHHPTIPTTVGCNVLFL
jgi:energy-coupling factor transporter ATP-binding protein EcfA2